MFSPNNISQIQFLKISKIFPYFRGPPTTATTFHTTQYSMARCYKPMYTTGAGQWCCGGWWRRRLRNLEKIFFENYLLYFHVYAELRQLRHYFDQLIDLALRTLLYFFDSFSKVKKFNRKVEIFKNYRGKTKTKLFLIRNF